ncbi:MAG: nitroreductase family protein [Clostridia bacterium]|nr:nitroreductase family protein [Clostridia bacterium]
MKRNYRLFITLLVLTLFSASLYASAGAESAVDTILRTGTTQAFTTDEVPEEDIQTILQAGVSTASAINQQPWYFVAITDQALMSEIGGSGMSFGGRPDAAPEGATPPEGMNPPDMGEKPEKGDMPAMPSGFSGGAKASLGDSPLAIIIYKDTASKSPSPDYDCGLATQNMVIAASALGYGVKIVSSPTMSLNGQNHDEICEKLGVDTSLQAVAVLLIGMQDESTDAVSSASVRDDLNAKSVIIH